MLISNALKPAEVQEIALCFELGRCMVVVAEDQLSLAIGKRGQNVRLAARLTGWDIDILTPAEYNKNLDDMEKVLQSLGMEDVHIEKMMAMGMVSLMDVEEVGPEPLVNELEIAEDLAKQIVEKAAVEARRIADEAKLKAAQEAEAAAAAAEAAEGAEPGEVASDLESAEEVEAGKETAVAAAEPPADDEQSEGGLPDGELAAVGEESGTADSSAKEDAESLEGSEQTEPVADSPDVALAQSDGEAEESKVVE